MSATITHLMISGINDLDPIDVYFKDYETGKGHITVTCWGSAWTSYWGAMGNKNVRQFAAVADEDYLVNKLSPPRRILKREEQYLRRIVRAIKHELQKAEGR